jgi:hypothetical protein
METSEKLPAEFKKKLVAALRSGEYKQGRNILHNDGSFCCLGVAYHIAEGVLPPEGYHFIPLDSAYHPELSLKAVPEILRGASGVAGRLAEMNDGFGCKPKPFSEIADWIEENL